MWLGIRWVVHLWLRTEGVEQPCQAGEGSGVLLLTAGDGSRPQALPAADQQRISS